MNFTKDSVIENLLYRSKRDARDDTCMQLKYESTVAGSVADAAASINNVPIIGDVAGIATASVAAVSQLTGGAIDLANTALGCDDIPFDEIKEIMDNRFNELDKKLDSEAEALSKINQMVVKTLNIVEKIQMEMKNGLNKIYNEITDNNLKPKITKIKNFAEYFQTEKTRINKLNQEEYVSKLDEPNGILKYVKDSRTPRGDTLAEVMYEIIDGNLAIPTDANDYKALKVLYSLFYGLQTFVNMFTFLLQSHTYLADYNYQNGEYDKFNREVDTIKIVFADFKSSLVEDNGFILKVENVLNTVKNKPFMKDVNKMIYTAVTERSRGLKMLKNDIKRMVLPVLRDVPPSTPSLQLKAPHYSTPLGGWKNGIKVRYAVQIEHNGMYSKLGSWSDPIIVSGKACPFVKVPVDKEGRIRLIFRKFNEEQPEMVAVLERSTVEFRDVDRDLYNAVASADRDAGLADADKFIEKRANVKAIFELGRTPLHSVAKSGNLNAFNLLSTKGANNINSKDRKGFTPLHLAAIDGRSLIIPAMVEKGADVNLATTSEAFTPLHVAAKNGFRNVIDALVKVGSINVNAKDVNGYTPLHSAVAGGIRVFMSLLKSPKIDINVKSNTGRTAAHLAAIKGDFSLITNLKVVSNFDINVKDVKDMTPLHYAAMMGNGEMVNKLITTFPNIELNAMAKGNNWNALHFAIYFKKTDVAIDLIKNYNYKVDAHALDSSNNSPLHIAAATRQGDVVKELCWRKAGTWQRNNKSYTPLHLAALSNSKSSAQALVNKGADLSLKTDDGKTALDLAIKYRKGHVKNYLESLSNASSRRMRRSFASKEKKELLTKVRNINIEGFNHHGNNSKFTNSLNDPSYKLLEPHNSHFINKKSSVSVFDSNSSFLLLDILLRKITKEKLQSISDESSSELEAEIKALETIEAYEKFLNMQNNLPSKELIDLSEVHANIKKAFMSGQNGKVTKILCSFAEKISSLKSSDINKMLGNFQFSKRGSENLSFNDMVYLMEGACI